MFTLAVLSETNLRPVPGDLKNQTNKQKDKKTKKKKKRKKKQKQKQKQKKKTKQIKGPFH